MLTIILILTALTVALFALTIFQLRPGGGAVVGRLDEMQSVGQAQDQTARRRRQAGSSRKDATAVRQFLLQAGFSDPRAVSIYWAFRVSLALGLPVLALFSLPLLGISSGKVFLAVLYFGIMGWIAPSFYVRN